jgi:hypothetical protein
VSTPAGFEVLLLRVEDFQFVVVFALFRGLDIFGDVQ